MHSLPGHWRLHGMQRQHWCLHRWLRCRHRRWLHCRIWLRGLHHSPWLFVHLLHDFWLLCLCRWHLSRRWRLQALYGRLQHLHWRWSDVRDMLRLCRQSLPSICW